MKKLLSIVMITTTLVACSPHSSAPKPTIVYDTTISFNNDISILSCDTVTTRLCILYQLMAKEEKNIMCEIYIKDIIKIGRVYFINRNEEITYVKQRERARKTQPITLPHGFSVNDITHVICK